jgi:tetratricopeptide (TPR) repeat protein
MLFFWNIAGDEVEIRKGLSLDSGSPFSRHVFCWFHDEMRRAQEAVAECRNSVELDPLSPCSGTPNYYQREYNQAIEQWNKTLEIDSRHGRAFAGLGDPNWQIGNDKEAIEQYIKAMQLAGYDQRAKELREDFEETGYK